MAGECECWGSRPSYRFRGRQILAAIPDIGRNAAYEVIFRLNMRLPTTKSGAVAASLSGGFAGSISPFGRHNVGACYAVRLTTGAKRKLSSVRSLPFGLKIQQPASAIQGEAVLREYPSLKRMRSAAGSELGCS